jgi:hypothetical protein
MTKSPTTPPLPTDPFAFFSEMLAKFESQMNAASNQAIEKGDAARTIARLSSVSAGVSRAFETMMENYLAAIKVPSRGQIDEILVRLSVIESRLDDLNAAAGTGQLDRDLRPTRTRQPANAELVNPTHEKPGDSS